VDQEFDSFHECKVCGLSIRADLTCFSAAQHGAERGSNSLPIGDLCSQGSIRGSQIRGALRHAPLQLVVRPPDFFDGALVIVYIRADPNSEVNGAAFRIF